MRLEYSPSIGALYVRLGTGEVANTVEIGKVMFADLDGSGEPIGIEFLNAADLFTFIERRGPGLGGVVEVDLPAGLSAHVRDEATASTK